MSKLLSGLEFRNTYVSTKFYSVYYILFFFGGGITGFWCFLVVFFGGGVGRFITEIYLKKDMCLF